MTRGRLLISAFIAGHLLAISIDALPPPSRWSAWRSQVPSAPAVEALASEPPPPSPAAPASSTVGKAWRVVRRAADAYLRTLSLNQRWAMFSNPPRHDQYLRTRYYVQDGSGKVRIVTELVRPAHPENDVRGLGSYGASFVDKALDIALSEFYRHRSPDLVRPDTRSSELPDDLAPVARYFSRRYAARARLDSGHRIIRTEVWAGTAPNPPLLERPRAELVERLAALEGYYDGPIGEAVPAGAVPPYHAIEREADIEWILGGLRNDMSASGRGVAQRWEEFWFEQIPPHPVAVLRILLGLLVLASVAGLMPVDMFWSLDGLVPRSSGIPGVRLLVNRGLGLEAGWLFIAGVVASAAAMTVGYQTRLAVPAVFGGLLLQTSWNHLPLSSAHLVLLSLVFCLMWSDSGRVLALDARKRSDPGDTIPAWPLWLIRYQVAVIYVSSGLWKLSYPAWRDGTAVYWALSLNGFHRFPVEIPSEAAPLLAILTWSTLLFELLFPVGVYFRRTRMVTLLAGVGLHVGLLFALEIGPFSLVMLASYVAFIDPHVVKRLVESVAGRRLGAGAPLLR